MIYVIIILILILMLYILFKVYFEKYDNCVAYTGGLGSGKSLRAVKIALKLLKQNRFKFKLNNLKIKIYNIFHKYKKPIETEYPLIYSSIPIFIKIKRSYFKNCNLVELKENFYKQFNYERFYTYAEFQSLNINKAFVKYYIESSCELTIDHVLLQEKLNLKSITLIDEIGTFVSQYEYNNPNVLGALDEFVRLYRQYTKGGYFICTDQSSDNVVKVIRCRLNKVFNLMNFRKFLCFYKFNIREISVSEEIKTIEEKNKEDNCKTSFGVFGFHRHYDTYCYSERYTSVPTNNTINFKELKRYLIFKIPKNKVYKPKTTDKPIKEINKGEK